MFNPESEEKAKELIELEFENAVFHYGSEYPKKRIAVEVLAEEIMEVEEELEKVTKNFTKWAFIKCLKDWETVDLNGCIEAMEEAVRNGIKEFAQVGAVIRKIKGSNFD